MQHRRDEQSAKNLELTEISTFRPFGTGGYSEIDEDSQKAILRAIDHDVIVNGSSENPTVREGLEDVERND